MITFTIVTITYNASAVLRRTTDSVMAQSYPHIEHLIIDGASTDGTVAEAEDYRRQSLATAKDHKVRITSEPDSGLYDAMNKGLLQAGGDYICFLNAGDFLPDANTIETIIANGKLESTPSDKWPAVLYGDTDIVDADGRYLHRRRLTPPARLTWRSFRHGMLVCHQAFYARTDIARRIPYDLQYRYSADVDWCIKVMREGARRRLPLRNVHATIACYAEEGQTTLHHKESLRERYRVMVFHYGPLTTMAMHLWFAIRQILR